jgi:prepilin-type N-terminal cleavage/methylation domain-containing protein
MAEQPAELQLGTHLASRRAWGTFGLIGEVSMHAKNNGGFTLIEIAIVLVIIGLLLGGVLKGQELINSAKVKNLANDFRVVQTFIYGYQDKFKALPGDDPNESTHLTGVTVNNGNGNGVINGPWNSASATDESFLFWRDVRLAGFAPGSSDTVSPTYIPRNADGGIMGIQSGSSATVQPITGLSGSYIFCSSGILGKFAKQLDITLDDGNTATGSLMVRTPNIGDAAVFSAVSPIATASVDEAAAYTVCMGF